MRNAGLDQSNRFIMIPSIPIAKSATRSMMSCADWNAANVIIMSMNGAMSANFIFVSLAIVPDIPMHSSVPATLARASSHTIEYVKSRLFSSIDGPTSTPLPSSARAPMNTAMDPDPGIPNSSVGTSPPPSFALFELSGPMTPLTSPFPNCFLSLAVWTVCPYAIQSTTDPPNPGMTPTTTPIIEHRMESHLFSHQSFIPFFQPFPMPLCLDIDLFFRARSIISGMAKIPNPTITSLIPSVRYGILYDAILSSPLNGPSPMVPTSIPIPAATIPLSAILPASIATIDSPNTDTISNSGDLNSSTMGLAMSINAVRQIAPTIPPTSEDTNAAESALAAFPFFAIGNPSSTVACDADDPGIPMSTDANVSDVGTTATIPIMSANPSMGSIPNMNGNSIESPAIPPSPGNTPIANPMTTPPTRYSMTSGCNI